MIQPQTRDGNRPECSGEVIREPLESAGLSLRASPPEADLRLNCAFRAETGNEPVREWLKGLEREDRKAVGQDVKTAQYGWPLGMPLIRKLEPGLWEVRSHIAQGIARVIFTVDDGVMVLLHGFVKKSHKTPPADLRTARQRLANLREE
jgi:phage-related protein